MFAHWLTSCGCLELLSCLWSCEEMSSSKPPSSRRVHLSVGGLTTRVPINERRQTPAAGRQQSLFWCHSDGHNARHMSHCFERWMRGTQTMGLGGRERKCAFVWPSFGNADQLSADMREMGDFYCLWKTKGAFKNPDPAIDQTSSFKVFLCHKILSQPHVYSLSLLLLLVGHYGMDSWCFLCINEWIEHKIYFKKDYV